MSELPRSLVAGKFDLERNGLIVGTAFAENLDLRVGDFVEVFTPDDWTKMQESVRKLESV